MKKIKLFTLSKMVSYLILSFLGLQLAYTQELLDPRTLTKYIDAMPVPGIMPQTGTNYYVVGVFQKRQQLHSELPPTIVWAYGPTQNTASYPGATFEVTRGVSINVKWINNLVDSLGHHIIHPLPVDQTLHWADPLHHGISYEHYEGPVPITVHVHGGEVEPESDGHPESWFTPGFVLKGEGWEKEVYHYVNNQQATTLWYHDHTLGITRLNVYMGLAGFYLIRDPQHEPAGLPSGAYEIPIVIQDRSFYTNGALAYDDEGVNPLIHPFWVPEFFGNTIVVNGKVWPYLNVEPRKYRFRFLNGSNARFYNLKIPSRRGLFIQIGTDGGYLNSPVVLNELTLGPGERADVIMNFTGLPVGTEIIMRNDARSPFPGGEFPNPQTVGQIMKFVVVPLTAPDLSIIPEVLNAITPITEATITRTLTLNEVELEESDEPLAGFLDGKMWDDSTTEKPHVGSTEIWEIVNLTGDAHPIHIHLVQTQLLSRQKFQVNRYLKLYEELNPIIPAPVTTNPPVAPYLIGSPVNPPANERGWKDTHKMFPGDVTRVMIRFRPQDQPNYLFDPTSEPGYVWHCHILEHEDNEMMRPMQLLPPVTSPEIVNGLRSYSLEQNYPNPFNPSTTLRFSIPQNGYITLKIYDVIGREVAILANEYKLAGDYSVKFDGSHLSSGVYFYMLIAGSYTDMKKMILIK